jgi:hypothetical protein
MNTALFRRASSDIVTFDPFAVENRLPDALVVPGVSSTESPILSDFLYFESPNHLAAHMQHQLRSNFLHISGTVGSLRDVCVSQGLSFSLQGC